MTRQLNLTKKLVCLCMAIICFFTAIPLTNTTVSAASTTTPSVFYQAHVQDKGWLPLVSNGEIAGTTGENRQLEALNNVKLVGIEGEIYVSVHSRNIGWGPYVSNNLAGSTGRNLAAEAFRCYLTGRAAELYDIEYRSHCSDIGWTAWVRNGEIAGTTGQARNMEAAQIRLVPKTTKIMYVKTSGSASRLNMRSAPNTSAGILTKLEYGTAVTVLSIENGWAKVNVDGTIGYVSSGYITNEKPNRVTNQETSTWSMPMRDAYCTWKSYTNMSWASYTKNSSGRNYHLGLDIYGSSPNVYAASAGTVVSTSSSNSGANGRYVVLQHTVDGKTVYSFYAHLKKVEVSVGDVVNTTTIIGIAGGSGYGKDNYYGKHLHFAVTDTLKPGTYYGYSSKFTGNKTTYGGVAFFNPLYIIEHNKLP